MEQLININIEETPEGLLTGSGEEPIRKIRVNIDNGIYELIVEAIPGGGYGLVLYHCEREVFSEACVTNWDELEEDEDGED
jgi:hypothetical protein